MTRPLASSSISKVSGSVSAVRSKRKCEPSACVGRPDIYDVRRMPVMYAAYRRDALCQAVHGRSGVICTHAARYPTRQQQYTTVFRAAYHLPRHSRTHHSPVGSSAARSPAHMCAGLVRLSPASLRMQRRTEQSRRNRPHVASCQVATASKWYGRSLCLDSPWRKAFRKTEPRWQPFAGRPGCPQCCAQALPQAALPTRGPRPSQSLP